MTAARSQPIRAARKRRGRPLDWLQPAVLTGSLVPFAVLAWRAAGDTLGANPIATAMNQLGLLALVFLVSSLACTPIKIVTGQTWPMRLRKTLGLMSFFAVLTHFLVYLVLDQVLIVSAVLEDVSERPFIAIGFSAFVLLIPLALTSTKSSLRQLGATCWKRLHRLVYLAAILGVVHFFLRVKKDPTDPMIFGAVLAVLLAVRVVHAARTARSARASG